MFDNISPVFIGWLGPLTIITPVTLLLRRWLGRPYLFAGLLYTASIITAIIIDVSLDISDRESAIVAGFRAPLVYCLLFTAVIAFYRYVLRRSFTEEPERGWPERLILSAGGLASGALIGGIIGLLLGTVIAFWLVTNIALQTIAPFYWHEQLVTRYLAGQEDKLFDLIIYLIGAVGLLVGGFSGQRAVQPKGVDQSESAEL